MMAVPLRIGANLSGTLVAYYRKRHSLHRGRDRNGARARQPRVRRDHHGGAVRRAAPEPRAVGPARRGDRRARRLARLPRDAASHCPVGRRRTSPTGAPSISWRTAAWSGCGGPCRRGEDREGQAAPGEISPRPRLDRSGIHQVLRTGAPILVSEVTDEMLEARARSPEHLAAIRELGVRSYMSVPLRVHNRTLGVITFVAGRLGPAVRRGRPAVRAGPGVAGGHGGRERARLRRDAPRESAEGRIPRHAVS